MIPLSLVTGFLGAGKTTFLKRVAEQNSQSRIVYLVNEFSPADLDSIQLNQDSDHVMSIPGGSIFCHCLAGTFTHYLTDIPQRMHIPGNPVKGVVIEASGTADPCVLTNTLAESGLDKIYEVASIVCIVDPGSVHKLLKTLPNIKSQIQAAGTILINKTDQYEESDIAATEEKLASLAPQAKLIRTVYADADVPLFAAGEEEMVTASSEYALCKDPNYEQILVECTGAVDGSWLKERLRESADDIYRAKGTFLEQDGKRKWIEHTAAGTTVEDAAQQDSEASPRLTFILRNGFGERFRTTAEQLGKIVVHA